MSSDGAAVLTAKQREEFRQLLDTNIPPARELAKAGKLDEALENLLNVEKQTRLAADYHSTSEVCNEILTLCYDAKNWKALSSHVVLLSKRRAQLKQVVVKLVQHAMKYLDTTPDKETKLDLLHNLRAVTAGKIHTELERARLTRMLSQIREEEGKIVEAADILQEVQVETYGAMEREEKVDYILEQVRLCMAKKDFIRTLIIAKKIQIKVFKDGKLQDLKLRYYKLLIEYYSTHEDNYLEIAKCWQEIYNTPMVQDDPAQWQPALKQLVTFVVLSTYDNEQQDMMHRLDADKQLEQLPEYKSLIKFFLTPEIAPWATLQKIFTESATSLSCFEADKAQTRHKDFQTRVIEHNIRTISKYYTRITTQRLAQLLCLDVAETERNLSNMVTSKSLWARINRPAGICVFAPTKDPNEILNDWAGDISQLLSLVEGSCHLIYKEMMMHRLTIST
jgi:26S proteasome regulatory subunit N5